MKKNLSISHAQNHHHHNNNRVEIIHNYFIEISFK